MEMTVRQLMDELTYRLSKTRIYSIRQQWQCLEYPQPNKRLRVMEVAEVNVEPPSKKIRTWGIRSLLTTARSLTFLQILRSFPPKWNCILRGAFSPGRWGLRCWWCFGSTPVLGTCNDLNLGTPQKLFGWWFRYFLFSCPKDIQLEGLILGGMFYFHPYLGKWSNFD